MRLLLLVAVVISACSHAVAWSLHHGVPEHEAIVMASRGIPLRTSSQALSLHRLLSLPDISRTLPELAHLYSDTDDSEEDAGWSNTQHRVDPTTDTEPWSRSDVDTDIELQTGEQQISCPQCDSGLNYDSSSSSSVVLSQSDENDEMKPIVRPSQTKRTNRGNQHGGRNKRETDAKIAEESAQKKSPAFNSWGGKRGSSFSSWGGKRNPAFSVLGNLRRRAYTSTGNRRSPAFNSWGGKRSYSFSLLGDNRHSVNSWAGNSNPTLSISSGEESPAFTVLGNKRQSSFHSWGGKRDPGFALLGDHQEPAFKIIGTGITEPSFSVIKDKTEPAFRILGNHDFPAFSILSDKHEPAFNVLNQKRGPAFNSWGGKRDASFNSWGGKRVPAFNSWGGKRDPAFNSWGGKRDPAFNSWGGKRDPGLDDWDEKRSSGFNSWGGKRDGAFSSWGGKRNDESSDFPKRSPKFSSWGGKREVDEDEKRSFSSWGGKRYVAENPKRSFSSWGGKRSMGIQTEEENHHDNFTSTKEVTGEEILADQEKEDDDENKDKEETFTGYMKENEDEGRRHVGTQTSLDFQQLLEEFGNKIQLEDNENTKTKYEGREISEQKPENQAEATDKADINMEHEEIGMDNKISTEEKGVGTMDSLIISKRNVVNTGSRVSKAMFNPWGGKRSFNTPSLFTVLASMSRGTGRSDGFLSDLLYKRGSSRHSSLGSKKWGQATAGAVFSSWGGKRSEKGNNLRKVSQQNMGRQYRRGADFYSWGGKR